MPTFAIAVSWMPLPSVLLRRPSRAASSGMPLRLDMAVSIGARAARRKARGPVAGELGKDRGGAFAFDVARNAPGPPRIAQRPVRVRRGLHANCLFRNPAAREGDG